MLPIIASRKFLGVFLCANLEMFIRNWKPTNTKNPMEENMQKKVKMQYTTDSE